MSTSVPTIILTWECKKDLADIKKFISSWLKFISSELIDLIGDLLFKILYSYHLNLAENLELKSLLTSSACKIDIGCGLR